MIGSSADGSTDSMVSSSDAVRAGCIESGNICSDTLRERYECAQITDDPGCGLPIDSPKPTVRTFCCIPHDCRRAGGECRDRDGGAFARTWCVGGTAPAALSCGAHMANPLCCAPTDAGLLTCGGGLDEYCKYRPPCDRQLGPETMKSFCVGSASVYRSEPCGGVVLFRIFDRYEGSHFYYDVATGALLAVADHDIEHHRFRCFAGVEGFRIPDACILPGPGTPGPGEVDICALRDAGAD